MLVFNEMTGELVDNEAEQFADQNAPMDAAPAWGGGQQQTGYLNPDGTAGGYLDVPEGGFSFGADSAPTNLPSGFQWDQNLAAIVPGGPSAAGPTAPSGGSGGGDGSLGSLLTPYDGSFQAPDLNRASQDAVGRLPQLPAFQAPGLPQFDPFQAPSFDSMIQNDQGYGGRLKQGEQALMNNKAAQGLARTGGTLKDLLNYNSQFASNEYGKYFDREANTYQMNTGNKFSLYDRDLAGRKAAYEPNLLRYATEAGVSERGANTAWDQAYKTFMTDYDMWRDQRDSSYDKLMGQVNTGLNAG